MQFTDSHLHLQEYKTKDAQQIIADLRACGFIRVVCASTSPQDWDNVAAFADMAPDLVIPAFGLHPWYLNALPDNFEQRLATYLKAYPAAWVGECGFDRLKSSAIDLQEEVFSSQIKLAAAYNRPLAIHLLKAADIMARFLSSMPSKFMFHSFSGSMEFLSVVLQKGAFISFSASILRRKNHLALIRAVPLNRLLLESDAPFLSDFRAIPELARHIAHIKGISCADLISVVNQNFKEFSCVK